MLGPDPNITDDIIKALESSDPSDALLVDFDETLCLRNSTETFLDLAKPRFLAAFILRLLDVAKPWRLLPGPRKQHVYRDWLRVLSVVVLMPWCVSSWRKLSPQLGVEYCNEELLNILFAFRSKPTWIISNGFRMIIRPLLLPLGDNRPILLAAPLLLGFRWRRLGKRVLAQRRIGATAVARATVITDGDDDNDLLAACRFPIRHTWPRAQFLPALRDAYVPFDYLENGKRPGQKHFFHVVVREELVVVWLAYLWTSPNPWLTALVLTFLHLSFWAVYEIGYFENDCVAARLESEPHIPSGFESRRHRFSPIGAWCFAGLLSSAGTAMFWFAEMPVYWFETLVGKPHNLRADEGIALVVLWMMFLLLMRSIFYIYNHVDKLTRSLLYAFLQTLKFVGFSIYVSMSFLGGILITSQVITKWIPYIVYRYGRTGPEWQTPDQLFRLIIFLTISLILSTGRGGHSKDFWVLFGVVLFWCCWRARHEIASSIKAVEWLPASHRRESACATNERGKRET